MKGKTYITKTDIDNTVSTTDSTTEPEKIIVIGETAGSELTELGFSEGFIEFFITNTRVDLEISMYDLMKEFESYEEGIKIRKIKDIVPRKKPNIKNNNPIYGKHNKGFSGGNQTRRANVQFRGRR